MRFGSVCSGIEAASVAWGPLGWEAAWLAEIEPFPSAVLAHHYPSVPNLGDMTTLPDRILSGEVEAPDLFCGGTPCQAFSVAGLRRSLDDARGNLSLTFCEIADAIDHVRLAGGKPASIVFWENVPGVLNTADNAFGCFLGALAGCDTAIVPSGRWTDAGVVDGPQRTVAWRTLDAQFFGLAQRRRRVFVVASARDGFDPAQVLLEWEGVRRDSAPSREAGKGATVCPTLRAGGNSTGGDRPPGTDVDTADSLQVVALAFGGGQNCAETDVSTALSAHPGGSRPDFQTETFVAHTLRGEGFDASEGGTGRGAPLVPVAMRESGQGYWMQDDIAGTLRAEGEDRPSRPSHVIGVSVVMPEIAGTMKACKDSGGWSNSADHAAAGYMVPVAFHPTQDPISSAGVCRAIGANENATAAVAFHENQRAEVTLNDTAGTVKCAGGKPGQGYPAVLTAMQVRRLTPVECERLQGFPTVLETVKIQACIDHQNSVVRAAIQCRRLQNNAWSAGESESQPNVKTAAASLITHQADREPLAALHVRMHSVDELLEVRSLGRLIWSANGVGASSKSLPPTLTGNTAQELARLLREAAHSARSGKVASPQNISLSFPASSGATSAEKSGQEMAASASGVTSGQKQATFTTSDLGRITTSCDSTAATLCCFALHAIAGCIPSTTLPETFSIELTVETPYTAIPWRGKPASECPDGPRYKALGNSWAVPVVRWIGRRIQSN